MVYGDFCICLQAPLKYHEDSEPKSDNLISHDQIKPKKLYYNQRETEAISSLNSLLSEENYKKVLEKFLTVDLHGCLIFPVSRLAEIQQTL